MRRPRRTGACSSPPSPASSRSARPRTRRRRSRSTSRPCPGPATSSARNPSAACWGSRSIPSSPRTASSTCTTRSTDGERRARTGSRASCSPDSNIVDPASQVVLVDNIRSTAGQPQRGRPPLRPRRLPLRDASATAAATTPATAAAPAPTTPRATATCSSARSCASPATAASRPATRSRGRAPRAATSPAARPPGNTCQETFAWGLRNPFRFAFDPALAWPRASSSTTWARARGRRSTSARRAPTTAGTAARETTRTRRPGLRAPASRRRRRTARRSTSTAAARAAARSPAAPSSPAAPCPPSTTATTCSRTSTAAKVLRLASVPAADDTAVELASSLGPVVHLPLRAGGERPGPLLHDLQLPGPGVPGPAHPLHRQREPRPGGGGERAALLGSASLLVTLDGSGQQRPRRRPAPAEYLWSFGDGSADTRRRPRPSTTHTYTAAGLVTASVAPREGHDRPRVRPGDRARERRATRRRPVAITAALRDRALPRSARA